MKMSVGISKETKIIIQYFARTTFHALCLREFYKFKRRLIFTHHPSLERVNFRVNFCAPRTNWNLQKRDIACVPHADEPVDDAHICSVISKTILAPQFDQKSGNFVQLTPICPRGAIWPPLVKIQPEQKIGLLVLFSCGCFWKILRHFHAPVKNYAGFVEAG